MKKTYVAYLGVLLLALHLSTQVVRAQATTMMPTNMTTMMGNTMPTVTNMTNSTVSTDKNGSGSTDAFTLLLPLALAASLLHCWS